MFPVCLGTASIQLEQSEEELEGRGTDQMVRGLGRSGRTLTVTVSEVDHRES